VAGSGNRSQAWEPEVLDVIDSDLKHRLSQRTGQGPLADAGQTSLVTPRIYGLLVVDDEEFIRDVLDRAMKQQGFTVWLAACGQEAINLYRRHSQTIDLVLLDVRMPGKDGPQTLAALQEVNTQVRCCFMSGDLGSYDEWQLCKLGAARVIRKPFRLAEMAEMLWELAGSAALSPSSL
jgi:CheY-like chemotaxis protein